MLELTGLARPRVCFLATAVGDDTDRLPGFYRAFAGRGCEPTHVELSAADGEEQLEVRLL